MCLESVKVDFGLHKSITKVIFVNKFDLEKNQPHSTCNALIDPSRVFFLGGRLRGLLSCAFALSQKQLPSSYNVTQNMIAVSFVRAITQCFARLSHRQGVCRSVCSSVRPSVRHTAVLCQNDASWDHEIFTMAAPRTLVFRDSIFCPWVRGFPSKKCIKKALPSPKNVSLPLQIGTDMLHRLKLKTILHYEDTFSQSGTSIWLRSKIGYS